MAGMSNKNLRLFAWRHTNRVKAKVPYNTESLIKFTPSYAYTYSWVVPHDRKSLRDSPFPAISPPYFVTSNLYGDFWVYVFLTSEKQLSESDIRLHAQSEVAILWSDVHADETHFRYWKHDKLIISLDANGTDDKAPIDIRSFTSSKHAKHPFRFDTNLGELLDTVMAPLVINRKVEPPLVVADGRFHLHGDPADYDSITLTALNPLEEGESPPSDRLLEVINNRSVQSALEAIADGANLRHLPGSRISPLELACFSGNDSLIRLLVKVGCPFKKDGSLIADSIVRCNPEDKVLKTIEALCEMGVSINAADARGMTPLHKAVHAKFPTVVRRLVELGADTNARDELLARTPLEFAIQLGGPPEIVNILT